jgi:glutaconate CoA-transferase subunit A
MSATEQQALQAADQLARTIPDGSRILMAPDYSGCAMAVVAALIRKGAKNLRLIGAPQLGLQAELLIASGCVSEIETAAISLGELGTAPAFEQARRAGSVRIVESTCPAIHAGLQAAERAVPFAPVRGIIGSDLVATRPDWKIIDNPYPPHDRILIVPAIEADIALFHSPLADAGGNVWIGVRRELMVMAHAAKASIVTADERRGESLLRDQWTAPGTIPSLYIDELAIIEGGGRPLASQGRYTADPAFAARYKAAFKRGEARDFIERWISDAALTDA